MTVALFSLAAGFGTGLILESKLCHAAPPELKSRENEIATTRFPVVQGQYLLPVRVGHVTYNFMVDTGAATTCIERSLAGILDWEAYLRHRNDESFWIYDESIGIGDREFRLEKIACFDLTTFRTGSGLPIMGILGMDFLNNRVLQFNFDGRELQIRDVPNAESKWEHEVNVELSDEPRPYVEAQVDGIPVRFLLDTGSGGGIALNAYAFEQLARKNPRRPLFTPDSSLRIDRSESGKLYFPSTTVELGPLSCANQIAAKLPDDKPYSMLGGLFLCRFNFELDLKAKKLRFSKSRLFAGRDCSDYGGIVMEHSWFGVVATGVIKGSIAERAGILPGDQIIKVGSVDSAFHGERRIVKALLEPRIANYELLIKRNGETHRLEMGIQADGATDSK